MLHSIYTLHFDICNKQPYFFTHFNLPYKILLYIWWDVSYVYQNHLFCFDTSKSTFEEYLFLIQMEIVVN